MSFKARLFTFLFLILFSSPLEAAPQILLPPEKQYSDLGSADDAIEKVYISDPYATENPKFKTATDLKKKELDAIESFIRKPGDPSKKHIYIERYRNNDLRSAQLMLLAKTKGIGSVNYITDLNQSMEGLFAPGQTSSTDFIQASFKKNGQAEVIQLLLNGGFHFNDPKYGIYSQPIFNVKSGSSYIPIMHLKGVTLVDENQKIPKITQYIGTGNWTKKNRFDRLLKVLDPQIGKYYLQHIQAMMRAFAKGRKIQDIPISPPLRVEYKDGSFIEIAFTDGRFNPNERITQELSHLVQAKSEHKITHLFMSHFSFTLKEQARIINEAMQNFPEMLISGIFDGKAVDLVDGYGISTLLKGYDTRRSSGEVINGSDADVAKRAELYVFQNSDKSWHDKTTIIEVEKNGKLYSEIYTGTLNGGMHIENEDVQLRISVPKEKSWIAKGFPESIVQTIKSQPESAIEMTAAISRQSIADITGQSITKVPLVRAEKVNNAILARDYPTVIRELFEQASTLSAANQKLRGNIVKERINRLERFLIWYRKNVPRAQEPIKDLRLRKLNNLAVILSKEHINPEYIETSLRKVIERPNLKAEQTDKLLKEAWTVFGMSGTPPSQTPAGELPCIKLFDTL